MTTLCALSILASILILLGIWWPARTPDIAIHDEPLSDNDVVAELVNECFRTGKPVLASRNDDGSVTFEPPASPRCRLTFDVPTLPVDSIPACCHCGRPTMHMGNVCYACSHPYHSAPAPLSQAIESAPQDVEPRGCAALYQYPMGDATEPFPHENAQQPFFTF